jgi:hypothetical protein
MRQDATSITIVLDRSGSMSSVATDTIGGFNKFLEDQKACPGVATLTLAQFDHEYEIVHNNKTIKEVPALDGKTFVPRGNTALLDAIGRTINSTGKALGDMPEDQRPAKVLFVIITDGQENASSEFTREQINKMICHQRDAYAWEFVFLAANQDAIATGTAMGVAGANSMSFAANAQGTRSSYASLGANVRNYRTGVVATAGFTEEDRAKQEAAGVTP